MEGINWTNWIIAGSAIISAISTVALAIITWLYVRLTRKMLSNAQKPIVQIYPRLYAGDTYLCVKNIGIGVARGLRFSSSYKLFSGHSLVEARAFFKNGIGCLLPGEVKEDGIGRHDNLEQQLKICVTYIDSEDKRYSESFCINLDECRDVNLFRG